MPKQVAERATAMATVTAMVTVRRILKKKKIADLEIRNGINASSRSLDDDEHSSNSNSRRINP